MKMKKKTHTRKHVYLIQNTNKETPCMFLKSTFLCNDTGLNRGMAKM